MIISLLSISLFSYSGSKESGILDLGLKLYSLNSSKRHETTSTDSFTFGSSLLLGAVVVTVAGVVVVGAVVVVVVVVVTPLFCAVVVV